MRLLALLLILLPFVCSAQVAASNTSGEIEKKNIGVRYLNIPYAHIHQNPNRFSAGLTTISCAHPMRMMGLVAVKGQAPVEIFNKEWRFVKAGPYEGYVRDAFLSEQKPECFQDRYSKFFEGLKLEIADMYYWGRLYDLYDYGHTKVMAP